MQLYNVFEKTGSGSNGLRKVNISPMPLEQAISHADYRQKSATDGYMYLVRPVRRIQGHIVNSVRTY